MAKLEQLLAEATITAAVPCERQALKIILSEALSQAEYDWDSVVESYVGNNEELSPEEEELLCTQEAAVGLINALLQQLEDQSHGTD